MHTINPGPLQKGWTVAMLETAHDSDPRNTCIAKALNWAGYAERSGYGTEFIIDKCLEQGLARPCFRPDTASFHSIIWRKGFDENGEAKETGISRAPVGPGSEGTDEGPSQRAQSKGPVEGPGRCVLKGNAIVELLRANPLGRKDIANLVGIANESGYLKRVLNSLVEDKIIERTIPDKPNSRLQKYRLTEKAWKLLAAQSAEKSILNSNLKKKGNSLTTD